MTHATKSPVFEPTVQNSPRGLMIVAIFSACVLIGGQSISAQSVRTSEQWADAARIKIGPGDLLQVAVFDEPELAQTVRVNDKGDADLLLLGTLHLAGLPTSEAQTLAENLLKSRDFLLSPHVSIIIAEYQTQNVSVLGEVKRPGVYPLLGARDLPSLISLAGGTTPIASSSVTIKRRSGQQEIVKTALSNNPDEMFASALQLEPGDTVMIPKAGVVYVLGEVGRPGGFVMQDNGSMSLTQAVAFASGVTHAAADTKARIIRKRATGLEDNVVNLKRVLEGKDNDVKLESEDIVYVPSSAIKSILTRAPMIAQSAASAAVYQGVTALP